MYPSAFILLLPSSTALFSFIEMSYMLSPCIKYYRSTPLRRKHPSTTQTAESIFLSFLQDVCIDRGVGLVSKGTEGQEIGRNQVPSQVVSVE